MELLTILGEKDSYLEFIKDKLSPNVKPIFFNRPDTSTVIKNRFVSKTQNRKLFEICYLDDTDIPKEIETKIVSYLEKNIKKYDLVVVNDFGHGFLTKKLIKLVCSKSKYLSLNVQTNSANLGFNLVTKYPRADCVCIDEMELRYATHDRFNDLRNHVKLVYNQLKCRNIITTRGSNGSLSYTKSDGFHETPAFAFKVIDAIGAGDAFFAFISPCFAVGMPQDMVSFIGNCVGSLATQIVCNREPVKSVDLVKFITRLMK